MTLGPLQDGLFLKPFLVLGFKMGIRSASVVLMYGVFPFTPRTEILTTMSIDMPDDIVESATFRAEGELGTTHREPPSLL